MLSVKVKAKGDKHRMKETLETLKYIPVSNHQAWLYSVSLSRNNKIPKLKGKFSLKKPQRKLCSYYTHIYTNRGKL